MHLHSLELHLNIKGPPQVLESTPYKQRASSIRATERQVILLSMDEHSQANGDGMLEEHETNRRYARPLGRAGRVDA